MRYPEGHKEQVRATIVEAASAALRRDGLSGVSIPALMKQVGLTHGGFYGHFPDRDALVAAAVLAAAEDTGERVLGDDLGLEAALRAYLSREHVDNPGRGCVLAALGGEARTQAAPVRHAFARAARGLLEKLQRKVHPGRRGGRVDDDTLALAARMVGAVVLARLVDDPRLAERLLAAARGT